MTSALRLGALAATLVIAATACSGGKPTGGTYTFHESTSPVKVDTAELRALKHTTDMQPCPSGVSSGAQVDGGLPAMTLPCLGGGANVDLAALRGPLVLNFWGQYCGPCRKESPLLQQFAQRSGARVAVLGVDFYDPLPSRAIAFTKELGVTYPQIADPNGATRGALHISALPMTFLIDKAGKVAYTQVGEISSVDQLAALVREHLGVSDPLGAAK